MTIGEIELQSGNGIPNHSSPTGSIYSNVDSGSLYICKGDTTWEYMNKVCYGRMVFDDARKNCAITATNTWFACNANWSGSYMNGCEISSSTHLVIGDNRAGMFEIKCGMSIFALTTDTFDIGLNINDELPLTGSYIRTMTSTTGADENFTYLNTRMNLNDGDKISVSVKNLDDSGDMDWLHGWMLVKRIGD